MQTSDGRITFEIDGDKLHIREIVDGREILKTIDADTLKNWMVMHEMTEVSPQTYIDTASAALADSMSPFSYIPGDHVWITDADKQAYAYGVDVGDIRSVLGPQIG